MDILNIKKAFEKKLKDITPLDFPTAYENVDFTPPKDKPYQRVQLVPFQPENPTLGDNYHRQVGEFQIFLSYMKGLGAAAGLTRAELIKNTFHRGFSLEEGGTIVTVKTTPEILSGVIVDDRYIIPIVISYFTSKLQSM